MEGIEFVVISDDEENEDEKFKADLELAKRLSLQVFFFFIIIIIMLKRHLLKLKRCVCSGELF